MMKLSKAQNEALLVRLHNEWRDEVRAHSKRPLYRNGYERDYSFRNTRKALVGKGMMMIDRTNDSDGSFDVVLLTIEGRIVAIDLLQETAAKEMESALRSRDREAKRIAAEEKMQKAIMEQYGLLSWQVDVTVRHKFLLDGYEYHVHFLMYKGSNSDGSQRRSDYVRINYTKQDGYFIDTTSSSFLVSEAMRMAELINIAGKVIMSNLLNS